MDYCEDKPNRRAGEYVPDSIQNRVRQFFLRNPDEELTYADLVEKFNLTKSQAHYAVRELSKTMPIESIHVIRVTKRVTSQAAA